MGGLPDLKQLSAAGAVRTALSPPARPHQPAQSPQDDDCRGPGLWSGGRSLFLNYELMIAFFEPAEVHRFARWIDRQRASASRYRAPGVMREWSEGLVRGLAFQR